MLVAMSEGQQGISPQEFKALVVDAQTGKAPGAMAPKCLLLLLYLPVFVVVIFL